MLRWSILGLFVIMALPSWAAKPVSVAQLEQALSAMDNTRRTDAEIAIQIGALEPSERISNVTLDRLTRLYAHGPQATVALQLLADRSSFLELPAGELPQIPAPDATTQQKLLEMARKFALETLPRLPNMLATRTTYSFDDSPRQLKKDGWPAKAGLHLVDIAKTEVNVRNERENIAAAALPGSHQPKGLMTWGEFGSALLMVQNDSAKGTTTWSHWEQFPAGPVAVFNYSVSQSASHYEIAMPAEKITRTEASDPTMGGGGFSSSVGYIRTDTGNNRMAHARPGYHGSLWIDPATGTILRITLIAEIRGNSNLSRAATRVEYGPVEIAGKSIVCPTLSFALTDAPANPTTTINGGTTEWLNENVFADYHLFATTSRIVSQAAEAGPATIPPIQTSEAASAMSPPPTPADQLTAAASPQASPAVSSEQPADVTPAPQLPSAVSPSQPEAQLALNSSPAAMPPHSVVPPGTPEPDAGLTLHVNVNVVLVPVVVRDEHGQSIDNLEKQDFAVFDDDKPRALSGFLVEKHAVPVKTEQAASTPEAAADAISAAQTTRAAQTMAIPARITVFVFDDLHLTADQISYAQKAAIETLDEALPGSDLAAIVTTSGKINSGLTRDRTILLGAMRAVRPELLYRPDTAECPALNYYQADLIANQHDRSAIADAVQQFLTVCNPGNGSHLPLETSGTASPSLQVSDDSDPMIAAAGTSVQTAARLILQRATRDLLTTYATIGEIAKKMATLPGQHTMILISPGFPPVNAEEREAESTLINLAAQSGVTINALNASGLNSTGLEAGDDTKKIRNPILTAQYREREMQGEENAIWELADGTGGKFFHNNNDLAAGFRALEAPETVYLLELPLEGIKPNGAWHRLSVKSDRAGAHLQARQGYFAPSKHAKHKQDFQGGS
jgi:VWFA-related protein